MSTNEWRDWALYALTSAAGIYSRYFFALLPLVVGLLLLFERRTWAECARGVWANVALAAACVPVIGLLREDMAYQASYLLDAPFSIVTVGYAYFSMNSTNSAAVFNRTDRQRHDLSLPDVASRN